MKKYLLIIFLVLSVFLSCCDKILSQRKYPMKKTAIRRSMQRKLLKSWQAKMNT